MGNAFSGAASANACNAPPVAGFPRAMQFVKMGSDSLGAIMTNVFKAALAVLPLPFATRLLNIKKVPNAFVPKLASESAACELTESEESFKAATKSGTANSGADV